MKRLIFKLIRYSGIPFVVREIFQRHKVTILVFHDMDKESADIIFKCIKKLYSLISLTDYLNLLKSKGAIKLPKKSLIITFDDGLAGNYNILPEVVKNEVPVTIFLCSEIINTNRHFWFNCLETNQMKNNLKKMTNRDKLKVLQEMGFTPIREFAYPQALNDRQIREMMPHIDFQSHGMYHTILTTCSYDEAKNEIFESKKKLERDFNIKIYAFAYPNGNYSDREIELCRMAGYECALTVDGGFNDIVSDPYRLKRIPLDSTKDINELLVKISGMGEFLSVILHKKPGSKYNR